MTRLLFFGDLAGTGFGTVTKDLGAAFLRLDIDVRFLSSNELGELPEPFASRTLSVNSPDGFYALQGGGLPKVLSGEAFGDGWQPEVILLVGDFFGARLILEADEETETAFRSVPTFHYVPIEGHGLPPSWGRTWTIARPVAMSEFGADQIERVTGTRPPVIYHGVDTDVFRPVTPAHPIRLHRGLEESVIRSKADAKRFFGADPRTTWLFRADRHMPRKGYNSLIRAMVPVLARHPGTFLVIHCRTFDEGGFLLDTLSKVPEPLRHRVIRTGFHDEVGGAPRELLATLYNAADIYVSNSSEGFGLTIAEAIACGTPAVGVKYSAVPEVIGPAGLTVEVGRYVDNQYDHFWGFASEQGMADAVTKLIEDEPVRASMGREGPKHVRGSFSWDRAAILFAGLFRESLRDAA